MSMITEQIKQLREHYKSCDLAGDYITRDMLKRAADTIETLSAKIHAYAMERSSAYNGGWIPTADRLPEHDGVYLVTTRGKGQVQMHVFNHKGNSEEYWIRCNKAWMPLPKPYED